MIAYGVCYSDTALSHGPLGTRKAYNTIFQKLFSMYALKHEAVNQYLKKVLEQFKFGVLQKFCLK